MNQKQQYLLAFRLFRMNLKPYVVTHRWGCCPLIATRAYESIYSSSPLLTSR